MIRRTVLSFIALLFRLLFRLRYKVTVKGKEILKDPRLKGKGALVLPNHPCLMDPFLILTTFGPKSELRPLVAETYYNYPFAHFIMKMVRAKPVAEFDKAVTDYKFQETERLYKDVVKDLEDGGRILLYPAAALKRWSDERIGGRSLAYRLMQDAKGTELILVRTTGFWGSMFSTAQSGGETPDFWLRLVQGMGIVLKNLIFFAPRRKITIEISIPDKQFPRQGSKWEFNKALEQFYNQYPTADGKRVNEEPLNLVPYQFWSKKLPKASLLKEKGSHYGDFYVPQHIRQDIVFQLSDMSGKSVNQINDKDDLLFDVGLDSMDVATIYTHLDTHFDIDTRLDPADLKTVEDLFAAAMHIKKGSKLAATRKSKSKESWPTGEKKRPEPMHADGKTLIETFLGSCARMGHHTACSDSVAGLMSYSTMKRAVVILAKKIRELDSEYIGILLPSTAVSYILLLAILLAKKKPVPLNWTVGVHFMNHAVELMDLKYVITSEKFLKKLDNVDLGKALDKLLFLENMRKSITLQDKISGALLAKKSTKKILSYFGADTLHEDDTAVVLFTSGTTNLPKAVPLSHKNLLVNQKHAIRAINLGNEDVIMVPLPIFHVFGLSVCLLPLFVGMRAVYSPDPLDSATLAKEILKWRVSIMVLAPTFYSLLFRTATLSQLKSLRVCISGAEKAPESLMEFINKLNGAVFLEGYGLTETSPIIAVNQLFSKHKGVGKILECVDLIVVDLETGRANPPHKIGEICVRGDTIFNGYYKRDNSDVFLEYDGKSYYKTGDLGYYDEENYLFLTGRAKLSFKKGGEMISGVAIETTLMQTAKEKGWVGPEINHSVFAVVPKETPQGSTKVVLFSEIEVTLDQVNTALLDAGFARIYKVNEIVKLDRIPMLKTGKTCYRELFEMVGEQTTKQKS